MMCIKVSEPRSCEFTPHQPPFSLPLVSYSRRLPFPLSSFITCRPVVSSNSSPCNAQFYLFLRFPRLTIVFVEVRDWVMSILVKRLRVVIACLRAPLPSVLPYYLAIFFDNCFTFLGGGIK